MQLLFTKFLIPVFAPFIALSWIPLQAFGQKDYVEGLEFVDSQKQKIDVHHKFEDPDDDGTSEKVKSHLKYDGQMMVRLSGYDRNNDNRIDSVFLVNRYKKLVIENGKVTYLELVENPIIGEELFEYQSKDTLDHYEATLIAKSRRNFDAIFKNEPVALQGRKFEERFDLLFNSLTSQEGIRQFLLHEFYHNGKQFTGRSSEFNAGVYTKKIVNERHLPIKD